MSKNTFHTVQLDRDKCVGCTNCIMRCPTSAIRVRDGKARIDQNLCVNCGECVRICEHHAKIPVYDPLSRMDDFEYTVALPAPSLYGQFSNLYDRNIVLTALKKMGFDMVYEVSKAADIVTAISRKYLEDNADVKPLISTACPSIEKLIQIRYPTLIEYLLPVQPPVEVAAEIARKKAVEESGLAPDKIGIFFISPCPAKVSACAQPTGVKKTEVDAVLAIKDVYVKLLPFMKQCVDSPEEIADSGKIGVGWGVSGGEAKGVLDELYLAADGIENCIRVLNEIEDSKFSRLRFAELNACSGGCVGGVLTVANPYVAKTRMEFLCKHMKESELELPEEGFGMWTETVEYDPVISLGDNYREKIKRMAQVERLTEMFPGLDCGSCGAPTCRALAEDIARGEAKETDCIHILMKRLHNEIGVLIGMAGKDFVIPGKTDNDSALAHNSKEEEEE